MLTRLSSWVSASTGVGPDDAAGRLGDGIVHNSLCRPNLPHLLRTAATTSLIQSYCPVLPDDDESYELLLGVIGAERTKQLTHFESLDAKAGLFLGVRGVILTLTPELPPPALVAVVTFAVLAGGCALSALWPRRYPLINVARLTDYAAEPITTTRPVLLDAAERMLSIGAENLRRKSRRLRMSALWLSLAGISLSMGIVAH